MSKYDVQEKKDCPRKTSLGNITFCFTSMSRFLYAPRSRCDVRAKHARGELALMLMKFQVARE